MKISNSIGFKGEYLLQVHNNGKLVRQKHLKNKITDIFLAQIRDLAFGDTVAFSNGTPIKYLAFAFGTDGTAEAGLSTLLGNEVLRKGIDTNKQKAGNSQLVTFTQIAFDEVSANPTLLEIGVFTFDGVDDETTIESTFDKGLLLSRIVINETLIDGDVLSISRIDTFSTV